MTDMRFADANQMLAEAGMKQAELAETIRARDDEIKALREERTTLLAEREQLLTDLGSRFEHSDHQSAKYYRRMRVAERVAGMNAVQRDSFIWAASKAGTERDALRAQLDAVREALTKDRVIVVTRHNGYTREDYSNPLVPVKAIEAALAEGAPDGQQ